MRRVLVAAAGVLGALLVAGMLGRLHPLGDSLGVFRAVIALALALVLGAMLLAGPRRLALAGLVALVAGAALIWGGNLGGRADAPDGGFIAYQKNMSFRMPNTGALAADIRAEGAAILTLQEVDAENRALLTDLADVLPTQHFCPFTAVGGTAVASRFPVVKGSRRCADGGFAAMRVVAPDGPLWVVSLHLHWPWPYGQRAHLDRLASHLAALEGRVVVGGDFNMVPRSFALARVARLTRTRVVKGAPGTYDFKGVLPLPIDHILWTQPCTRVTARPKLGSDHRGLVARLPVVCPGG